MQPTSDSAAPPNAKRLVWLTALGIVYGDVGTSPLYAVRECFNGEFGVEPSPANVMGVMSLIFWALVLVISIKYLTFVLRADNHGEGGVLALTALLPRNTGKLSTAVLLALGLFAASLLYGDGMITPANSVLSAVEGLSVFDARLADFVLPVTIVILLCLFAVQSRGTARIGAIFGPVTLLWFLTIGTLGVVGIAQHPGICAAALPTYAITFLTANGLAGFLVLGAVFLVVTGAEALYADMGHFGTRPIRFAWWAVVLPCLLLSYFGQGASILESRTAAVDPFYGLAPQWMLAPLIILATMATIIASQAVISGAFSLTRQAVQLGYCPRMQIVQTSASEIGQVYVPQVNWILLVATIGLVIGFRTSSALAAAYGVAVTSTMVITTLLFCRVARTRFGWNRWAVGVLFVAFLVFDLTFFGANITKVFHGAWFPLAIGGVVFLLMTTWRKGRMLLSAKQRNRLPRIEDFLLMTISTPRVTGAAVFLTSDPDYVPSSILHNLRHNGVIHERVVFLNVTTEEVPRTPRDAKVEVEDLGSGFHRIVAHYGYYETPNVPHVIALAREQGLELQVEDVSFFLARERLSPDRRPGMSPWRERIFAFLSRNALGATVYFGIPPAQVVEIGAQVRI